MRNASALLALPAVLLLCAGLALYPALAALLVALRRWRSPSAAALALALAWTLAEMLRGSPVRRLPLEPDRLRLRRLGRHQPARRGHRRLGPELARGAGRRPAGGLLEPGGPRRWRPAAAGGLLARPGLARRHAAAGRGAGGAGDRRRGCAWCRATSRSTTSGSRSCARAGSSATSSSRRRPRRRASARR